MSSLSEDALEILKKYDTVLIVDDSGSMIGERWRQVSTDPQLQIHNLIMAFNETPQAGQALAELAAVAARYDTDGIEIHFLNSSKGGKILKVCGDYMLFYISILTGERTNAERHHFPPPSLPQNADDVKEIFDSVRPYGRTPLGKKLNKLLKAYLKRQLKSPDLKAVNYIVLTDGVPCEYLCK